MELSLLVANALRSRRPELLVREQVDAELVRLTEELVERELAEWHFGPNFASHDS